MKHWRKHFGSNFLRVCVCCRGRGGGDHELEHHFGGLVNKKAGSEANTRPSSKLEGPLWSSRREEEEESRRGEAEEEGLPARSPSAYNHIMSPAHHTDTSAAWVDVDLRCISAAGQAAAPQDEDEESDASGSDISMAPDVDDVAKHTDLEQRRFFDFDRARIKEKHNELGGILTGVFLTVSGYRQSYKKSHDRKSHSRNTKSPDHLRKESSSHRRGENELRPPSSSPSQRTPSPSPGPGAESSQAPMSTKSPGRRSSMPMLTKPRRSSTASPGTGTAAVEREHGRRKSCEVEDRGRHRTYGDWEGQEMQDKVKELKDFRSRLKRRASQSGLEAVVRRMSNSTFGKSFHEHLAGGRGELVHSEATALERRRSSTGAVLPPGQRHERRGSWSHKVSDHQLDLRLQARERLLQPSIRTQAKEEERRRSSGQIQPMAGDRLGLPPSPAPTAVTSRAPSATSRSPMPPSAASSGLPLSPAPTAVTSRAPSATSRSPVPPSAATSGLPPSPVPTAVTSQAPSAASRSPVPPSAASPGPAAPVLAAASLKEPTYPRAPGGSAEAEVVVHYHERLNFISHAYRESVMATSHLQEAVMKEYQHSAAQRKQLEAAVTQEASRLEALLELRQPAR